MNIGEVAAIALPVSLLAIVFVASLMLWRKWLG